MKTTPLPFPSLPFPSLPFPSLRFSANWTNKAECQGDPLFSDVESLANTPKTDDVDIFLRTPPEDNKFYSKVLDIRNRNTGSYEHAGLGKGEEMPLSDERRAIWEEAITNVQQNKECMAADGTLIRFKK